MNFYPLGPYELPQKNRLIPTAKKLQSEFWDKVEEDVSGLSDGVGCYIYSIRAGKGNLPWYVGMAVKQSFRKECFTPHKINKYNEALGGRRGTPLLTFIPRLTKLEYFCEPKSKGYKDVEFLEKFILSYAIKRNPNLLNIKDTRILKGLSLPGVINSSRGANAASVRSLKQLLGL